MHNKRIGIPGYLIGENTFGVNVDYLEFVKRFGKPIIITPEDVDDIPDIDLLILPGGPDILPSIYGATPSYRVSKPSPMLEHFDKYIFPQYFNKMTPIFGICRGAQFLWVHFGGNLIQHYPYHPQSKHQEDQCHELLFTEEYRNYFGNEIKKVTSRHHQVCSAADNIIPDELEIIAYAGDPIKKTYDPNVVEIFKHTDYPLYGVQYHPENHDHTDNLSSILINELLDGDGNNKILMIEE